MTWDIVIPNYQPPRLNQFRGRHWSAEHQAKKELRQLLSVYARDAMTPPAVGKRRVTLYVTLTAGQKEPDRDAWDKALLDALVGCGLLTDDSPSGLEGRVTVLYTKGIMKSTTVRLEEA